MLAQYEQTLNGQFGSQTPILDKSGQVVEPGDPEGAGGHHLDESSVLVFDQLQESIQGNQKLDDWEKLTERMQNPFTMMRRWLKFEILDLEAILEAIDKRDEMEKRKHS